MSPSRCSSCHGLENLNLQALVQVGHFLEVGGQGVEVVVDVVENFHVGEKRDGSSAALDPLLGLKARSGCALCIFLAIETSIPADLDPHSLGEAVDHRGSYAVQPAGYFVGPAAELGTGVQGGHDGLEGGHACGRVNVDGYATAIVVDGDPAVLADADVHGGTMARHCLVDGVVDDLVNEVVQAALVGAADVHTGAAAHGLQALKDLDILGCVVGRGTVILHKKSCLPSVWNALSGMREGRRKRP